MPGLVEVAAVLALWVLVGLVFWTVIVARGIGFELRRSVRVAHESLDLTPSRRTPRFVVRQSDEPKPMVARRPDLVLMGADLARPVPAIRRN